MRQGAWEAMVSFDVSEILHTIRVPTLVIAGAADGLLPWNLRYCAIVDFFKHLPYLV